MLCIGPGPGPKNVLAEDEDGNRTVVPYAVWKHKHSKEAEIAEYRNFIGFVQFDPNEREVSGQPIKDFALQPAGSAGGSIRVTLWPELSHAGVKQGDSVHVSGKFTTPVVKGKQYFNLSATDLTVNGRKIDKITDEVENPVEEEDDLDDLGF